MAWDAVEDAVSRERVDVATALLRLRIIEREIATLWAAPYERVPELMRSLRAHSAKPVEG